MIKEKKIDRGLITNIAALIVLVFIGLFFGCFIFRSVSNNQGKSMMITPISLLVKQDQKDLTIKSKSRQRPPQPTKTYEQMLSDDRLRKIEPAIRIDYVARQLAISSPSEAIKMIDAESDSDKRMAIIAPVADEWSKIDPEACYLWAESLSDQSEKQAVLVTCMANVIESGDINLAYGLYDKLPAGQIKDSMLIASFEILVTVDKAGAIERLGKISNSDHLRFGSDVIAESFVATNDLSGLRSQWDDLPYGSFRDAFEQSIIRNLAKKDPSLGLDWILARSGDGVTPLNQEGILDSLKDVASAFAAQSPLDGLKAADVISNPVAKGKFLEQLSSKWSLKNPDDAIATLVSKLDDSGYENNKYLVSGVLTGLIDNDHNKAFALVETIKDPESHSKAKLVVIEKLATIDPKAAGIYITKTENVDSVSIEVVGLVASKWLVRDPLAASAWISNLPLGDGRDEAVERLVLNILRNDTNYSMAESWAMQISNTNRKNKVLKTLKKP